MKVEMFICHLCKRSLPIVKKGDSVRVSGTVGTMIVTIEVDQCYDCQYSGDFAIYSPEDLWRDVENKLRGRKS